MTILVTGGTGSLGKVLVPELLKAFDCRVRVLSRDEHKQTYMAERVGNRVDFLIGDIRDRDRVVMAAKDCSAIIHLAAMKSVDKAEYNPNEAISINIKGTQNVAYAALYNKVRLNLMTSTDKAVEPLNIYGATKLTAEKQWVQSNCYVGPEDMHFSVMRYGNVLGSAGSVIEKWQKCVQENRIPQITAPDMTRFFIRQYDAAQFLIKRLKDMRGGEVFIPVMKATTMMDMWKAFSAVVGGHGMPDVTGVRAGEKMHETLISKHEIPLTTIYNNDYFIRFPNLDFFPTHLRGEKVHENYQEGFHSSNAPQFEKHELESMVRENLNG